MAPDLIDELQRKLARKPHEELDDILDTVRNTGDSAGEDLAELLDSLPLGEQGPHRVFEHLIDGIEHGFEDAQEQLKRQADEPLKGGPF